VVIAISVGIGLISRFAKSQTEDYPYKNDPPTPAKPEKQPDSRINVITDPGEVSRLRHEATQQTSETSINSLAKGFRRKDPSVMFTILNILQGQDTTQSNALMSALTKNASDDVTYSITDGQLVQAILAAVGHPDKEAKAVELAGSCNIAGFPEVFERRLTSGNSAVNDRLIFWLSRSPKGANIRPFLETNLTLPTLGECLLAIAVNGNELVRARVGELALKADKALPNVLECCFKYCDERVVPIAEEHLKHRSHPKLAMLALLRISGPKYFNELTALLKDPATFDPALEVMVEMDKGNMTDELLRTLITQMETQIRFNDDECYNLARILIESGKAEWLNTPGLLSDNTQLITGVDRAYKYARMQLHSVVADLRKNSLVPPHYSENQLEELWKRSNHPKRFVSNFFDEHSMLLRYDTESGESPVPYVELIEEYKAKSQGALSQVAVWANEKGERITVLSKDKAYVVTPENKTGDWYDVTLVDELISKVLADLNCTDRFMPVNTGDQTAMYVYGYPARVNPMIRKYLS
jgi:hypothetical protein